MKKRIFITATNTDIGKTYTTQILLKKLAKSGYAVGVIKPVETGVQNGIYPDGDMLLSLLHQLNPKTLHLHVEDVVPIAYELPAAPYVASGGATLDISKIDAAIAKMEELCDVVLIEGAGGIYVPLQRDFFILDLILHLKAKAVLVTHCSLGCINDTLVHQNALKAKGIEFLSVFNCRETQQESFKQISLPFLEQYLEAVYTTHSDDFFEALRDFAL